MNRDYVIISDHKSIFGDSIPLFWGRRTEADEQRCYGGYTSNVEYCEKYTKEELESNSYRFAFYGGGGLGEYLKLIKIGQPFNIKISELEEIGFKKITVMQRW